MAGRQTGPMAQRTERHNGPESRLAPWATHRVARFFSRSIACIPNNPITRQPEKPIPRQQGCRGMERLDVSCRNKILRQQFFQGRFGVENFTADGCVGDHAAVAVFLQGARTEVQQPADVVARQVAFAAQARLSVLADCLQLTGCLVNLSDEFLKLLRVAVDCVFHC